MLIKNKIVIVLSALFTAVSAQTLKEVDNKINSPYSRFGFGDFYSGTFGASNAMGGAAIALPLTNSINTLNPASYSNFDTLTFILDFGFRTDLYKVKYFEGTNLTGNTNIDHFAVGYTVNKWWGGSLGVVPFSKTGFDVSHTGTLSDSIDILQRKGMGEINRIYLGNAFDLTKSLSIGANISYVFGNIIRTKNLILVDPAAISYYEENKTYNKGFLFDLGFQYKIKIGENRLTLGMTYQPESILNTKVFHADSAEYPNTNLTGLWNEKDTLNVESSIPQKMGIGVSFRLKDKLSVGVDYKNQDWTDALFAGENDSSYSKSQMFNFGLQYSPNIKNSRNYLNKVSYRLGGYYHQSHIKIGGKQVKESGITLGFGLPFKNTNTVFNLSFEAGKRGNLNDRLVEENFIRINLNISLYDFWFYKPKID